MSLNNQKIDDEEWVNYISQYIQHSQDYIQLYSLEEIKNSVVDMQTQKLEAKTEEYYQRSNSNSFSQELKESQRNRSQNVSLKRKGPASLQNEQESQQEKLHVQNENIYSPDVALQLKLQAQIGELELKQQKCEKKQPKQHIYSKNYRQRKKQAYKQLQQQNIYLKNKVSQLQNRLRQLQLQLTRLKMSPQLSKSLQQTELARLKRTQQLLQANQPNQLDLSPEFNEHFDKFGFGGTIKVDKLNYHMNEFLEGVMEDCQKYMLVTVITNTGILQKSDQNTTYPQIKYTILQAIQFDQLKIQAIRKFLRPSLRPAMQKIQTVCQQLYQKFRKVLDQIATTHKFMKQSRDKDFITIKQRLQIQNWFHQNKYTKQLRNLRANWIQSLKQQKQDLHKRGRKKRQNKVKQVLIEQQQNQ